MKKRTHTTKRIGDALNQVNDLNSIKDIGAFQRILANWSTISDAMGASIIRPTHFKDGRLTIEFERSEDKNGNPMEPDSAVLNMTLMPLLQKFSVQAITYVVTQHEPKAERMVQDISTAAAQRTTDIADTDLRNAMASLLTAYDKSRPPS